MPSLKDNKTCVLLEQKGKGFTTQKSQRYHMFSQISALEQYILMMAVWLGEYQATLSDSFSIFRVNPVETGLHTIEFKIVVGSCIRKIKTGDQFTLDDLHYLIQKSVDFDLDHLYFFEIRSGTLRRRYFAPECEGEELKKYVKPVKNMVFQCQSIRYTQKIL